MAETATAAPRIIRFGVFEVDLQAGELRKQGLKVKLQEKPFQVLALLLERPGKVATREQLQKRLWPDINVDFEANLNAAVKRLRDALGDSDENPRFIETLGGRGYRFIAPVEEPGPPAERIIVSRYRILAKLGEGGMGEVYRAEDTVLGREVALKRLAPHLAADEAHKRRLLREARSASALNHPNIASLFDVLDVAGETFLVMEYVDGRTLRERLRESLSIKEFLAMAVQCGEALVAAHEKGIVHRDIKPENIMVTPKGHVKILDFGVAKRLPHADESTTTGSLTSEAGGLSGTPAYMAPEVWDRKEADGRADIFSLGVVFYECLTGRHPFDRSLRRILGEEPPPLTQFNPRVSTELERIVAKMLAKDPAERHATAADLLVDLRRFQRGPQPPPRPRRWARWGAVAGLAVLLAGGLVPPVRETLQRWVGWSPIPEQKNLVVLPFVNVGGDPANQAFCDGLTYTLTSKLTQLEQFHGALLVVPASDVVRRQVSSAEEARNEFGVNLALTGSVQRTGDHVRLTVNLVDAGSLRQLRSLTLDGDATDPSLLQDHVVRRVAELLEVELEPPVEGVLAAGRTGVARAYDFYLQGRGYLQNYDKPENIENAITVFNHALELDANYALAHAGLGEAYWRKYDSSKDAQWVEAARQACERALALEAKLASAHVCLGRLSNGTGEYARAVAEFSRALESEPTSDAAYRGLAAAYDRLGDLKAAEQTYQRAIELRPNYWGGYSWLGVFYFRQGRYAEAAEMFEQVVALTPDNARGYSNLGAMHYMQGESEKAIAAYENSLGIRPNYRAYSNLGTLYFFQHRYADAAQVFERALQLDDRDYRVWHSLAAAYYWAPGERGKARAIYERAAEMAEERRQVNPHDPDVLILLADCYAMLGETAQARTLVRQALALAPESVEIMAGAGDIYEQLGDRDRALEWIGRALEHGYGRTQIERAPSLQQLREDARFQRLLQRTDTEP